MLKPLVLIVWHLDVPLPDGEFFIFSEIFVQGMLGDARIYKPLPVQLFHLLLGNHSSVRGSQDLV